MNRRSPSLLKCDRRHTLTRPKGDMVHQRTMTSNSDLPHAERPGQQTKEHDNAGGNLHVSAGKPSQHDPVERLGHDRERYPLRPDHLVPPACRHAADRGTLTAHWRKDLAWLDDLSPSWKEHLQEVGATSEYAI